VHSGAAASGRALAIGGLDATGRLASGSQGVFGLDGVNISSATNASGSVLTSSSRNVRLDRGTRMLLVNGSASGSAAGAVSKAPSEATLNAAGGASGAANVTREPAPRSTTPAREPVDRR
ncbi:MAG: hypothetical protein ACREV5_19075, partial [Steroidobacter sp.]